MVPMHNIFVYKLQRLKGDELLDTGAVGAWSRVEGSSASDGMNAGPLIDTNARYTQHIGKFSSLSYSVSQIFFDISVTI